MVAIGGEGDLPTFIGAMVDELEFVEPRSYVDCVVDAAQAGWFSPVRGYHRLCRSPDLYIERFVRDRELEDLDSRVRGDLEVALTAIFWALSISGSDRSQVR